jgi:mono/diheme cytochrome c family protein
MFRKIFLLAVLAIVAGAGRVLFVTMPVVVSAAALPAYTPNVANGKAVFDAGGCASCHGVAGEPRTMLGGGWRSRRRSAPSTCAGTSRRTSRTASATGARRISSTR